MKSLFFLLFGLITTSAFALPKASFNALEVKLPKTLKLLENQASYNFEGIVKLSNCSGSMVIFNGMPDTAKAMVMTNGHCINKPGGYLNAGEVWLDRKVSRDMKIFDSNMKLHPIKATKILYATMTGTDVAFYELTQSYAQIEAATGIRPLMMATYVPYSGIDIQIMSGYWDRGWDCKIHSMINNLREGEWTWDNSLRYTETCDTMGGTSGSPITTLADRTVIGINNTSNESGEVCTLNNPCEVDVFGKITTHKGVRYGQNTWYAASCLTPDFRFDLKLETCEMNF